MRITRFVAGTVAAGLLGVTPIALAAPAEAKADLGTTVTAVPSAAALTYGDDFSVSSDVTDTAGAPVYKGTSTLYAMEAGSTAWVPVVTEAASYSIYDVKPQANTAYKIVYSGYAAVTTSENNLAPSESAPFGVEVARKLTIKNPRGTFIKGKVAPDYKKKKVLIHKKVGKRWVKFRTLKTNKKSAFATTLPASRKRTYFRIMVKGDSKFATAAQVGSTISYRSTTGRLVLR